MGVLRDVVGDDMEIVTSLGSIKLKLRPDAAPMTCQHMTALVGDKLYDNTCFYRSDFVIQCGLQRVDGTAVPNPHPNLAQNETSQNEMVSNNRGTVAIAHWGVPDNGNSEFFINLKSNGHLDTVYGGYCCW